MRILIADDHPLFRNGVRNLLSTTDDLKVVGEAASGEEVITMAQTLQPDVILMDIRMPDPNGIEATRKIKEMNPNVQILMLTMFKDDHSVFTAMQAGARGYVLKNADEEELLRSIRMVGSGGAVFSPDIASRMIQYFSNTKPVASDDAFPELTIREREILNLIADGATNAEIAKQLQLSAKTVANYVSNILNKLHVVDRNEAKRKARELRTGIQSIDEM